MTLAELTAIYDQSAVLAPELFDKVSAAVIKSIETVRAESVATANHEQRLVWARLVMQNPTAKALELWPAVLAANAGLTQSQVLNASDSGIETAVLNAINVAAIRV